MKTHWPPASVHQRRIDLVETRKAVAGSSSDSIQTALARYLVVRAAGYLESVRDDVAEGFADAQASPQVTKRIRRHLRTAVGVQPNQLLDFVNTFDSAWRDELKALLSEDDGRLSSEIGAMVSARKNIAHGDGDSVTVSRAIAWCDASDRVAMWFVKRFDPSTSTSLV